MILQLIQYILNASDRFSWLKDSRTIEPPSGKLLYADPNWFSFASWTHSQGISLGGYLSAKRQSSNFSPKRQREKEWCVPPPRHTRCQLPRLHPQQEIRWCLALGQSGDVRETGVEWLRAEKRPHRPFLAGSCRGTHTPPSEWGQGLAPEPCISAVTSCGWAHAPGTNTLSCLFLDLWNSCEHIDVSHFVQRVRRTRGCFPAAKVTETWQNRAVPLST